MNYRRRWTAAVALALGLSGALLQGDGRQLAARPADEWIRMLEAPARVANLRVDEIIAKLGLKPGDVVADLGAGAGAFALPLARAVGPEGKVYAVEIEQGLVDHIARKAREQQAANVQAVLGKFADPALPASDVDLVFMHDVLHHVEDRQAYLKNAARYVKTGGRFAFVELDAKTGAHRDDPKLQLTREQLAAWMADVGFAPLDEFQMFKDKWFVVFARKP
jgi:ubiquinone/menaquinone biosynthesis C-methylase UbiE